MKNSSARKAAFMDYVSPSQINVLAPADSSAGSVSVTVTNSAGTSDSVAANMQPVLPGLSVLNNYVRAVRHSDGAIVNGTGTAESGYTTVASAKSGDVLALYGTGFGPTTANVSVGALFTRAYDTTDAVTVTVGGVPAQVMWAGLVGPGLYQINMTVPSVAAGDQAVVASVAGLSSQATGALLKVG